MNIDRRQFLGTAAAVAGVSALAAPAFAADPIKVGSLHDLSGGLDIYGKPMVDALTFAIDEANAAGGLLGRQLHLINYDTQSSMQLYTQFAQQAALKDKVAVVHGGITSASREVIRPVLDKFKTLYFYNTQYEGGVCDRNQFDTGVTPAQTVEKLVPYAMKKWGKKVYVVAADYNYGQITSQWVKKYVTENGGEVPSIDFFPLDVTNFGPTISKIQAAKPDFDSATIGTAPASSSIRENAMLHPRRYRALGDHRAAIDDDGLPGDKRAGPRRQQQRRAGDVDRLPEPAQRRRRFTRGAARGVFVKRAGEFGLDQTRRDAIDAHVMRSEFGGEVTRELEIGGLRNVVSADRR